MPHAAGVRGARSGGRSLRTRCRAGPRAGADIPSPSIRSGWRSSARPRPHHPLHPRFAGSSTRRRSSSITRGDYYRTRLTHTMEAAQVTAHGLARAPRPSNEDLAEAVALAPRPRAPAPSAHAGRADARPSHGAARRIRAQRAEPPHRRRPRRAVPRFPRTEPLLGAPRGASSSTRRATTARRWRSSTRALAPCLEAQIVDFTDEIAYNAPRRRRRAQVRHARPRRPPHGAHLGRGGDGKPSSAPPHATVSVQVYQAVRRLIDRLVSDLIDTIPRPRPRDAHRGRWPTCARVKPAPGRVLAGK